MLCPDSYCRVIRKVIAIETREWFFKCGNCRFGRYTGQSKQDAEFRLTEHSRKKNHRNGGEVWYRRVPEKSEFVKALFGRKIKNTISPPVRIFADEPILDKHIVNVPLPDDKVPF